MHRGFKETDHSINSCVNILWFIIWCLLNKGIMYIQDEWMAGNSNFNWKGVFWISNFPPQQTIYTSLTYKLPMNPLHVGCKCSLLYSHKTSLKIVAYITESYLKVFAREIYISYGLWKHTKTTIVFSCLY